MSCKVRPYGARVVVKREEAVRQVGSIVVPDSVADKEKPRKGIVLEVSEQSSKSFKPGDKVIFGKYAGVEVETDGEPVLILKTEDIHGFEE